MNRRNFIIAVSSLAMITACKKEDNVSDAGEQLLVFSSITCSYCRTFHRDNSPYFAMTDRVKVIPYYRNMVDVASQMVIDASGNRSEEVKNYLYENDDWLAGDNILANLNQVVNRFDVKIDLEKTVKDRNQIDKMVRVLEEAVGFRHITGTPAFFIGERALSWDEAVEFVEELKP
ncbi:MAG: DsbA family protein [Candidatus Thiodiazotropha taylori]|uniref:DsbA family protein n=1 Tax=Candidatus Thiodiazotropha taylori TaxID=2792791 RepID=A0A9E4N2H5_9GAMM|nr:DsbA family protein [Candidatus Thiodiazotropha taylori]MCW4254902.1 DsbA family protein [Candidatus Thiodiazotropha taylori]